AAIPGGREGIPMRRGSIAGLSVAALLVLLVAAPAAVAGGQGDSFPARDRWRQTQADRRGHAVWRGLHPGPAQSFPSPAAPGSPTAWTTLKAVRQIRQDSSTPRDGSEPDTQAEPYIAMDPNDAGHIVAVVQQGRFPDGASVGPGYSTSQDG